MFKEMAEFFGAVFGALLGYAVFVILGISVIGGIIYFFIF